MNIDVMQRMTHAKANAAPVPLDAFIEAAKALAHRSRVRVLAMLRDGPLCVCQITAVLGVSGSTVSAHLSDLRRAGLLAEQKKGRWVYYRLTEHAQLRELVMEVLDLLAADPHISGDAQVIESLRTVSVDDLCRAGLDLAAVGMTPRPRKSSEKATSRKRVG